MRGVVFVISSRSALSMAVGRSPHLWPETKYFVHLQDVHSPACPSFRGAKHLESGFMSIWKGAQKWLTVELEDLH